MKTILSNAANGCVYQTACAIIADVSWGGFIVFISFFDWFQWHVLNGVCQQCKSV